MLLWSLPPNYWRDLERKSPNALENTIRSLTLPWSIGRGRNQLGPGACAWTHCSSGVPATSPEIGYRRLPLILWGSNLMGFEVFENGIDFWLILIVIVGTNFSQQHLVAKRTIMIVTFFDLASASECSLPWLYPTWRCDIYIYTVNQSIYIYINMYYIIYIYIHIRRGAR